MAAGTAYAKRYGAGFTDGDNAKQVDSQFLNAVESSLLQLIGAAPTADGQIAQWDNANTRFGPALLLNKNVDPAAAISSGKIDFTGANGLTNAAIAGAAAIARSKLNFGSGLVDADIAAAAALGIAKLAGYPADGTKALFGDATWKVPGATTYRKTTAKAATNTVAETDLLNGEITLAAGVLGASGVMRLTAWGDAVWTSGAAQPSPRIKFKLGSGPTTVIDTGAVAGVTPTSATRFGWRITVEVVNLGAANSQWATISAAFSMQAGVVGTGVFATGEGTVNTATANSPIVMQGGAASAVDTTLATLVQLTTINGSATTTEVKLFGALVEVI